MTNPLYQQHMISIKDLTKETIEYVIRTALALKAQPRTDLLHGKVVATCFFEPSTRTRLSFESAILRLGGGVIGFSDAGNTSAKKGETLADTIRMVSGYADAIVIRHPQEGAARLAATFSNVPIINGGDGANQHPTQTMLDLLSLQETQGRLAGLRIAFVGDLKYGRTVHSLVQALSLFGAEFYFVSPKQLALPEALIQLLAAKHLVYHVAEHLDDVIPLVDAVYMTRIQRERFDEEEFSKIQGDYVLRAAHLRHAQAHLRVFHPLPRVGEIATDVDDTPHAYYFEQAKNGVFARQALLALILNPTL